jgi:hypothetical protein
VTVVWDDYQACTQTCGAPLGKPCRSLSGYVAEGNVTIAVDASKPCKREQCGSRAGYFRHRRAGEETCRACRDAEYAANADRNAARQRAYARLAKEQPDRWRELYAEELERRGLQAVSY